MKPLLLSLKDFVLLVLVCTMILISINQISHGLTASAFWEGVKDLGHSHLSLFLGVLFICIQLAAMQWSAFTLNIFLTITSTLLFALMVTLTFGPAVSLTPSVQHMAESAGIENILQVNSALYWLIPLAWFICLLGAKHQVRTFCMAIFCYALWVICTPMLNNVVADWAAQESPVLPQLLNILLGAGWMPSVALGCFLLIFSLFVDILDTLFPEKKKQKTTDKATDEAAG